MKREMLKKLLKRTILVMIFIISIGTVLSSIAFSVYYKLTLHMDLVEAFGGFICCIPLLIAPFILSIEGAKSYFNYKINPYRKHNSSPSFKKVA